MSIVLGVIKGIFMLLLILCIIFVIVLAIVLIAPIRYEAYYAKYEEMAYDIKVTYLLGIKGKFYLDQEKKNHKISIFGKTIYKEEIINQVELINEKQTSGHEEITDMPLRQESPNPQLKRQTSSKGQTKKMTKESIVKKSISPQLKKEAEIKIKKAEAEIKDETIETVKDAPMRKIVDLVKDPMTYVSVKQIGLCLGRMIKVIWPKAWDFELVVGKGDPADTGECIAGLTMFYPLYYKHGIIRGAYDRTCIEGGFLAKGRFSLGCLLWQVMRLLLNKHVFMWLREIIHLRKEEENGK